MKNSNKITFDKLSHEWMAEKKISIKESTYVKYHNILQKHILPFMGTMPIEQIDTCFLIRFSRHLISGDAQKNQLAYKSVKDILSVLNNILKYAKTYYPTIIPAAEIVYPQSKQSRAPIRILSHSEQCIFRRISFKRHGFIKTRNIHLPFYRFAYRGNMRIEMGRYRFRRSGYFCKKTVQRLQTLDPNAPIKTRLFIDTPKSSCSIRVIPIPTHLLPEIRRFFSNQRQEYVLTGSAEKCMEPRTFENHFMHFLKQVSQISNEKGNTPIDLSSLTVHSLRHTFATRCVEAGVEIKCLSEILGHANVNISLNRYVHSSIEMKRTNINKLSPIYINTKAKS